MQAYFADLERRMRHEYEIAKMCRAKGFDPELDVEIPPAEDLAARVEALCKDYLPQPGVADRIRELSKQHNRELVSLMVAKEVAAGKFGQYETTDKAVDGAVRVGLAILTEGILVAPLEGIDKVRLLKNDDGTSCIGIMFAGPIRAAGGTGQALSVLIADVVRRELGFDRYKPTEPEIMRLKEEIPAYKQAANLQYTPTADEIDLIARGCPIMIDGEGTEDQEISGNRDLPRIESNRLRGGACLVFAEGLTLKAPKIQKHVKTLKLEGWEFIDQFLAKGKGDKKKEEGKGEAEKPKRPPIEVNWKYMNELVAGRPVFSHPSRKGGWRLRYGRARTGGLATTALHPASMILVDDFLAVGTQMKIERPGKATATTPCDTVEGPIVLMHSGAVMEITSAEQALEVRPKVKKILDLGEILIPFGEFAENNKTLSQAPWCEEWWELHARKYAPEAALQLLGPAPEKPRAIHGLKNPFKSAEEAVAFAEATKTPLHPAYNLFWHDLPPTQIRDLAAVVLQEAAWREGKLRFSKNAPWKETTHELGLLQEPEGDQMVVGRHGYAFVRCLGLDLQDGKLVRVRDLMPEPKEESCEFVGRLAGFPVMPRGEFRVGTRMGRPEKAAERKMNPPVHSLFPIGQAGGAQRLMSGAAKAPAVEVEIGDRQCQQCKEKGVFPKCHHCGGRTLPLPVNNAKGRPEPRKIPFAEYYERALRTLDIDKPPEVKAVVGLISKNKTPEPIEKGILRAKHELFTFKDSTVRFDMININLTHFKPREIHTSVGKLVKMGYTHDVYGEPLTRDDQVLEIRVQDVIVSTSCVDYMLRCSQYIDELLVRFYGVKPFYNCKTREDLMGHMFVALAPHTSGGVLCRIIGWNKALGHFGHPYFHAAKRRNADGDEDCVMLLLDGLLNFSRAYLPSNRGGLMDAPLTLTQRLDPSEVDKEAHNVDVMFQYPLEFFELTVKHPSPGDAGKLIETVSKRLGTAAQYEGIGFTHDTGDIAEGPDESAYKTLGDMREKMDGQLGLAARLRAVDAPDVAARVIGSHLLPDLMGNLKSFSKQKMRCTKCSAKFRRVPVSGKCLKCGNPNLTMTVHEGSVKKYLEVSKEMCIKYGVNDYVRQRIEHIEDSIESTFQNDRVKKAKLSDFF
ncbi:MAG TPA: DNA polymerase II large subunit [Candidatus Thermoplasmatota archaeon]|nr:DNA polymerase II large subunit [Candidatus Thermoplasmatota archaeon]